MEPISNNKRGPTINTSHTEPPLQVAKAPYQRFEIYQTSNAFVIKTASEQTASKINLDFFQKILQALHNQTPLLFKDLKGNTSPLTRKHQVRLYIEHMFHVVVEQFPDQFANIRKMEGKKVTIKGCSNPSQSVQFVQQYLLIQTHLCTYSYPDSLAKLPYEQIEMEWKEDPDSTPLIPFLTQWIWEKCGLFPPTNLSKQEAAQQLVLCYLQDLKITFKAHLNHLSHSACKASEEICSDEMMIPVLLNPLPFSDEHREDFDIENESKQAIEEEETLEEEELAEGDSAEGDSAEKEDMTIHSTQSLSTFHILSSFEDDLYSSLRFPVKYILDLVLHRSFKKFLNDNQLEKLLKNGTLNEGDYFFSLTHLSYPHLAFYVAMKDDQTSCLTIKHFKVERNSKGNFVMPIQKNSNPNIPQRAIETTSLEDLIQVLKDRDFFRVKLKQPASFKDRYSYLRSYYLSS